MNDIRERVIAEIHSAFADVSRGDGMSWAEADLEGWGTEEETAAARRSDPRPVAGAHR